MSENIFLIVEDQDAMRQVVREALAKAYPTARIISATNGLEALVLIGRFPPVLVVMDRELAYLDGVEATRRIKALLPETKVVFFSLSTSPTAHRDAVEAGADGYVTKTDGVEQLLHLVNMLLLVRDASREPSIAHAPKSQLSRRLSIGLSREA
jgi:DNA-binding NarL/FixJ family response regulator